MPLGIDWDRLTHPCRRCGTYTDNYRTYCFRCEDARNSEPELSIRMELSAREDARARVITEIYNGVYRALKGA